MDDKKEKELLEEIKKRLLKICEERFLDNEIISFGNTDCENHAYCAYWMDSLNVAISHNVIHDEVVYCDDINCNVDVAGADSVEEAWEAVKERTYDEISMMIDNMDFSILFKDDNINSMDDIVLELNLD